jgi:hypothetical protein
MMQGLLDFIKTPEGQGLLSGVFGYAANARRGTPINNLGRGGIAGLLGYSNAMERQDQQAENQWMQKYRQMQMDKAQYDMERTRSADAEQARKREVLRNLFTPTTGAQAIGADGRGPTADKVPLIGQMPQINYQQLLAEGFDPDQVKALAEARNFGRQKVARTVKGIGPDGREYEYQVDDFGERIGEGLPQYRAPIEMDTGGRKALLDPYNFQEKFGVNKTMTPGERASNAVAWANVQNARERLDWDRNKEAKPTFNADAGGFIYPPDMRNPNGRVVPVAGMTNFKPLTESQGKANLFGVRALESNKVLEDAAKNGTDRPGWIKRTAEATVGIVPDWAGGDKLADATGAALNWTQSADQQRVEQAQRDFINAILRRESGAVISPQEFTNAQKQYFPMVGDSEEVIKQKKRNREIAIQGIESEVPGGFRTGPRKSADNKLPANMPSDIQDLLRMY